MPHAIALYSGGLDSTLAILAVMRQGIDVTAVTFLTHFGCDISDRSSCSKNPFFAAERFGFEVKLCHLADKFLDIVKNPKFGHGKNMNPCIDCRILMLKEAKELMAMQGADFIITGEVLGQRPMSQRRDTFPRIDREAGLQGYVLRPLSAKLLNPTIIEQREIVNREELYNFHGRSRKPQIALAREFGLNDYPAPAGGCLLTDPIYSYRLRELLNCSPSPSLKDINLLRMGRHFRISDDCKIIVGRNKDENSAIYSLSEGNDYLLEVKKFGSPLTIMRSGSLEKNLPDRKTIVSCHLELAASICARYSDAKHLLEVEVAIIKKNENFYLKVQPANDETIKKYRIGEKVL